MAYELTWHTPNQILSLVISGNYSYEEATTANQLICEKLDASPSPLFLLIDASDMARTYKFDSIRITQTYMNHEKLSRIIVVALDRLVKLSMMVIFHLSTAPITIVEDTNKANIMVNQFATIANRH